MISIALISNANYLITFLKVSILKRGRQGDKYLSKNLIGHKRLTGIINWI